MIDWERIGERADKQLERVLSLGGSVREGLTTTLAAEGMESADIRRMADWIDLAAFEHATMVELDPQRVVRSAMTAAFLVGYFTAKEVE